MVDSIQIRKYAIIATSHIIASISESETKKIRNVILFGSVAQGTATSDSDIDIFFDVDMTKSSQRILRTKLNKAAENFYLTTTSFEFKLKSISNELSIQVGKLEEWPDLKRSIISTGIVLYGRYLKKIEEDVKTIFSIERIGRLEGALLNKLYGYKSGKKHYPGLIKKMNGERISRAFIVPAEQKEIVIDVFKKYNVEYSVFDVSIIWVLYFLFS